MSTVAMFWIGEEASNFVFTSGRTTSEPVSIYDVLRPSLVPKKILQYSSHQMFGHIHKALNAVEKITNYTVKLISTS